MAKDANGRLSFPGGSDGGRELKIHRVSVLET